jgi:hypothetical protein
VLEHVKADQILKVQEPIVPAGARTP